MPGGVGQFDVVVEDQVVAKRKKNILTKLFGGGWPDHEKVVRAIRDRESAAEKHEQA